MSNDKLIEYLEYEIKKLQVDNEILLDYITHLELKYIGYLVNGRLPLFDEDD